MQQKQKKSEVISKKADSFAKMMLQRDKNRVKAGQKHAYTELLKAPRGKDYLRLLAETAVLCDQLTKVEDEIVKLEAELKQEPLSIPAFESPEEIVNVPEMSDEAPQRDKTDSPDESEIKVTWKSKAAQESSEIRMAKEQPHTQVVKEKPTIEQSRTQVSWKSASMDTGARIRQFKEKQQRLVEMKRQREELAEQFRTTMREFQAQLPVPDKLIGMIWPELNTDILMKYGIIPCPGFAFDSPEELIEHVQPKSEKEEKQWLKGNEVCHTYLCDELLIVEIYMEAICVVYKDGNTLVIE